MNLSYWVQGESNDDVALNVNQHSKISRVLSEQPVIELTADIHCAVIGDDFNY